MRSGRKTIPRQRHLWNCCRAGISPEELLAALGDGDPTVVFSLKEGEEPSGAVGEFDFENHRVLLNSGYTMPIMGLGTYALDHDTCVNSVKTRLVLSRFLLRPGLCSMECPE